MCSIFIFSCLIQYNDFQVDAESYKELKHWKQVLKIDAIKLCKENNSNTGFCESTDNIVTDVYELKVFKFKRVCIAIRVIYLSGTHIYNQLSGQT